MWLLDWNQQFHALVPGQPFILGREYANVPEDNCVSRTHIRITVEASSTASLSSTSPTAAAVVTIEQVGKLPTLVFRQADLFELHLIDTSGEAQFQLTSSTPSRTHLDPKFLRLERGSKEQLRPGDGFALQTAKGIAPFFVVMEKKKKLVSQEANSSSAASTVYPPLAPSTSLSHHSHHSQAPNHATAAASAVPVAAAAAPPSQQHAANPLSIPAPATSLHTDPNEVIVVDSQMDIDDDASQHPEHQQAMPAIASMDEEELAAERQAFEAAQNANATTAAAAPDWSQNDYSSHKRRKFVDASQVVVDEQGKATRKSPIDAIDVTSPPAAIAASSSSAGAGAASGVDSNVAAASTSTKPEVILTPTLVFPCLSVGDYRFAPEKACPLCFEAIRLFLFTHKHPDIRLYMVVPGEPSQDVPRFVANYFKERANQLDSRFRLLVGDITNWVSLGIPSASFLIHSTNWRFNGGEGGRIIKFLPEMFVERLLKMNPNGATKSKAYVSEVARSCALVQRCPGVMKIITLMSPSMNDEKQDSLRGNYLQGCEELKKAYAGMFQTFAHHIPSFLNPAAANGNTSTPVQAAVAPPAASVAASAPATSASASAPVPASLMPPSASLRQTSSPTLGRASQSPSPIPNSSFIPPTLLPPYHKPSEVPSTGVNFKRVFYEYLREPRPANLASSVFWEDDSFLIIYDAYPKARIHLLVIPKKQRIESISNLTIADLGLIDEMDARGKWLCDKLEVPSFAGESAAASSSVRIPIRRGFHAIPSINLVHLHIISQDMDSPALKHKKHWNSFNTAFFITPQKLKEKLINCHMKKEELSTAAASSSGASFFTSTSAHAREQQANKLATSLDEQLKYADKLLEEPLRCNRVGCMLRCTNLPELKRHLVLCDKPYDRS